MKKLLFVVLCLALILSLPPSVAAAPPPPQLVDPEPPVVLHPSVLEPDAVTIDGAVLLGDLDLGLGWTAPVSDQTNSLVWGDYDLDGDLDLLVGNRNDDNVLYRNDLSEGGTLAATWTFTCETDIENTYSVAWGDFYNLDGYLDVAIGNFDGKNCIHKNNGDGTFTRQWLAEVDQYTRSVAWAGWDDGSGFSAFLAVGNDGEPTAIYKYETGSLNLWWYTDVTNYGTWSVAWGDYDRDGDPDLALGNSGDSNLVYRNDGTSMTEVFSTTEELYTRGVAWGDMDGDGYLDLAMGNGSSTGVTHDDQVYCNDGPPSFGFSECWTSSVESRSATYKVAWGDWDGDGDLDLAATSGPDGMTRIYPNEGGMLDNDPGWDADDEASASRAVAWADWDGDGDLELAIGYYGAQNVVYENTEGAMILTDVVADTYDTRSVAWGDVDGDGLLDLALGNSSGTANLVFPNTGTGFGTPWTSPETENTNSVAWGDFDNDGDLDLAAGNGLTGGGQANRVYINSGGSLGSSWTYGDGDTHGVAWGDFDGDQDLDLAVGNYGTSQPNQIYISGDSAGISTFTGTLSLVDYTSDQTLDVAWADFDQDYDLDLAVANQGGPNRLYVNDGGTLSTTMTLPGGSKNTWSLDWGDWNDDGYPDLAVGNAGEGFQILEYMTATSTFDVVLSTTGLDVRSVAWGDYDGDGDLDLAVGLHGQFNKRNRIYRNEGGTLVQAWQAPSEGTDPTRSVAWGDYDNDGDLDLAIGNYFTPGDPYPRVYVNTWNDEANLANDPAFVHIEKPGTTDNAWFFANYEIIGTPTIDINYTLFDDEYDRAFEIEPQVSWDGGDHWQPATEATGAGSDGTTNLAASPAPAGTDHLFVWDVLNDLLAHQGLGPIPVAADESFEEMDVAFRIVVWSNPDHGGLIQRPLFGSDTTLFRVDMRPDWYDSIKLAEPKIVHPGEELEFTVLVTQTDHGMPPGGTITDPLPIELSLFDPPTANYGNVEWSRDFVTWTGALEFDTQLQLQFSPRVTRPLTNGLILDNCAYLYDGLHLQFTRCTTAVISSTVVLTESWKEVIKPRPQVQPGDPLTYTIWLTNTGTENAYNVLMTDTLPANVLWADHLTYSSGIATYADGMITWLGDVKVFEPVSVTFQVTIVQPLPGKTLITNTAWISASDELTKGFYIDLPIETEVWAPDLRPSAKKVSADMVELGDILAYTIVLSNGGNLDAERVDFVDPIPPYQTYVPGSFWSSVPQGGYDDVQDAITWSGAIAADAAVMITFAIKVGRPADLEHPVITNTAQISESLGGDVTLVATATLPYQYYAPIIFKNYW